MHVLETEYGWDDIARRTEMVYDPDAAGQYVAEGGEYMAEAAADDDFDPPAAHGPVGTAGRARGLQSCVFRTRRHTHGAAAHSKRVGDQARGAG